MTPIAPESCDACLRRAFLIARLAPRIAGLLDRPGPRVAGLLALSESDLLSAVAGPHADRLLEDLDRLDLVAERERFHQHIDGGRRHRVCAHRQP
jgi:hypothetical protein